MSNKIKGNILEDLVAMMHEVPGVLVEKRKKLPVLRSKTKRKREVDVLLTSSVAGYPVKIALGCKNEAKALDTHAVDNFVGILNDVGIPIQQGILVSANGYTRDAQDAADTHGLRALVFEGLSADRLGQEINAALKAVVYLLVSQFSVSMLPYVEDGRPADGPFIRAVLDRDDEPPLTQILTVVWELWVSGKIPDTIGEHLICLAPKNPDATWMAIITVTVEGWMASVPGFVSQSVLKDTKAGTIDRVHVAAKFDEIKGPLTLEPVNSEETLADVIKKSRNSLVIRVRVPRIGSDVGYWPPTAEAAEKVKALIDAGVPVTFEGMESTNIMDAWRFKRD
jgi:Restriction endonuclease